MPCGKKSLVKTWDKSRNIRVVKPSQYQQNEASVKVHWKNVVKELELFYKDEQFWETQAPMVRDLVGEVIFERLVKIFNLQIEREPYIPVSPDPSDIQASEDFYCMQEKQTMDGRYSGEHKTRSRPSFSMSDFIDGEEELEVEKENDEDGEGEWSSSLTITAGAETAKSRSQSLQHPFVVKSFSKNMSKGTMSRSFNKSMQRSFSNKMEKMSSLSRESAFTDDDVLVHAESRRVHHPPTSGSGAKTHKTYNPHFQMLYCNESETDMIKWDSKYKKKKFQVSASDEYSKKAELLTKQIAYEFFAWWNSIGSEDYRGEIKRPEDIEDLFQVWFDEHASRGLVLDPKILPCVIQSIANYVGVSNSSCPRVLKRHVAWDIEAESKPAHTMAFGRCLPLKMKHIPPKNNTKVVWHGVHIPEDLKSMTAVWEDIMHLTSTKSFHKWLAQHPHMPMPPCLKDLGRPGEKKQLFVVPSDFVVRDRLTSFSTENLNIPISELTLEIKEVLSRLLND